MNQDQNRRTDTNGNITQYVYAADGRKLRTKRVTAVEGITVAYGQTHELTQAGTMDVDSTDYFNGSFVIHWNVMGRNLDYHFGGGYLSLTPYFYRPYPFAPVILKHASSYHYYLRDHLGSNRLVVGGDGTVEQTNEYYPYGGPWGDVSTNQGFQPYKYTGKELDRVHGLDWYDFGARHYDPAVGLFTQIDPLCEQYPHLSPYAYCAGNPVRYVDPDGRKILYKDMSEEDEKSWRKYLDNICQQSDLFATLYQQLSASKEIYMISLVNLSANNGSKNGFFEANMNGGGTIFFSNNPQRRTDPVTLEEFFHAYQHDNRKGYANGEFNREFEAKTFVVAAVLGEGSQMMWGDYPGMNDIINPLIKGYYKDNNFTISPAAVNSSVFRFLYNKVANSYGMFNATMGIGRVSYKRKTEILPYSLMKVITETSLRNWRY